MLDISDDKIEDILKDSHFYSLRTLKTPGLGRLLARVLLVVVGISMIALFLPWQQNIRGGGKVTTLQPENRPQTIESAIAGRIERWHVREGQNVAAGDTILSLSEVKDKYFDPQFLMRLKEQITAKEASLEAKKDKQEALRRQIQAFQDARRIKINQITNKLEQSKLKLQSDSIALVSEQIQFDNAKNLYERNQLRYDAGNIPLTKFQEIESKFQESTAKVFATKNKYFQAQADLKIALAEINGTAAEYADKISKAQSDLASSMSDLYDTEGSLSKMRNEYANMEIRNRQYQVVAPQSGYVVKALKAGIGETIKEGEAVASIMPLTDDLATEMYIKAMDLPFINLGRPVRIQFDGWPSLQFSGWPNVSVGTFGGIVAVIDRIESKPGTFRILVKPDPNDEPWPSQIRMGSGIKGWVMLNDVPIWFELWRQLNGFPPTFYEEHSITAKESK